MSFDRVADVYDATRGIPTEVAEAVAGRIVEATNAGPDTRILELGVGTGRIALPLIADGYLYTGVDISAAMLAQLRAKTGNPPNLTIVEGDVRALPFPDGSFDVALTVHVLHLVPEWRQALAEARRVLTPDGYFVLGHDHGLEGTAASEIRRQWRIFVEDAGVTAPSNRATTEDILAELTAMGGRMALYHVARWERTVVPSELIGLIHNRKYSWTWDVPQPILDATHQRIEAWARERYGDLDQPQPSTWEFVVAVTTFG